MFSLEYHIFFLQKSCKKKLAPAIRKMTENSGTRFAPEFLRRFLFDGFWKQSSQEKKLNVVDV